MLGAGLLAKTCHAAVAGELCDTELQRGPNNRHARQCAVRCVKGQKPLEVYVGEAVGVGGAKGLLVRETILQQLQPPAGRGIETGVETFDAHAGRPPPRGGVALDHLALVAGRQQKPRKALCGIEPDHVTDDRLAADLHERLGNLFECAPAGVCHARRRG